MAHYYKTPPGHHGDLHRGEILSAILGQWPGLVYCQVFAAPEVTITDMGGQFVIEIFNNQGRYLSKVVAVSSEEDFKSWVNRNKTNPDREVNNPMRTTCKAWLAIEKQ
uniref:Uncharacterized protein n=1 Tax=Cacopsylla melanoneura TaxID=428564 RepID=A0A8D8TKA3_9HEMI